MSTFLRTTLVTEHVHHAGPDADGHWRVRALLTLEGEAPPTTSARAPLALSLVLDRSGSMAGEPLAAARDAAVRLVRRLRPDDVVSVVAYDHDVTTVAEPAPMRAQPHLAAALAALAARGNTNLSGGWLRGRELVERARTERAAQGSTIHRVVLMTDGRANEGITDGAMLAGLCARARVSGITTTTIGFGAHHDEDLLRAMADAGGGNTYYVERLDQARDVFAEEIDGLLGLAAQNVAVEVRPTSPAVRALRVWHDYPSTRHGDALRVTLGDLYAHEPRQLLVECEVAGPADAPPAEALVALTVRADALTADGGVAHEETVLPVQLAADAAAGEVAAVRTVVVLLEGAEARTAALRDRDAGDLSRAARRLREASVALAAPAHGDDPTLADEARDLAAMADRLEREGAVSAADEKYLKQMAYGTQRGRAASRAMLRRPQP